MSDFGIWRNDSRQRFTGVPVARWAGARRRTGCLRDQLKSGYSTPETSVKDWRSGTLPTTDLAVHLRAPQAQSILQNDRRGYDWRDSGTCDRKESGRALECSNPFGRIYRCGAAIVAQALARRIRENSEVLHALERPALAEGSVTSNLKICLVAGFAFVDRTGRREIPVKLRQLANRNDWPGRLFRVFYSCCTEDA